MASVLNFLEACLSVSHTSLSGLEALMAESYWKAPSAQTFIAYGMWSTCNTMYAESLRIVCCVQGQLIAFVLTSS